MFWSDTFTDIFGEGKFLFFVEEKKNGEGKGESIWRRRTSFFVEEKKTKREKEENIWKSDKQEEKRRGEVFGGGKYIFLWRRRKRKMEKKNIFFVCLFVSPNISWGPSRSFEIFLDPLSSLQILESHNDNVDNVGNFGSMLRQSKAVSDSRWQNLWSSNQWINLGFKRW